MPGMTDPLGRTYWLDEWAVVGARMNFFSYADDLTPGGPHETDTPSIDEMADMPEDPDGYMPTPQSCEDIDFLLNDYTGRKNSYDGLREMFEAIDVVSDSLDILTEIFFVAGIAGITSVAARWSAIRSAVEGASARLIVRLGAGGYVGGFLILCLYLSTLGTQGRWDARIATLSALAEEWDCEI